MREGRLALEEEERVVAAGSLPALAKRAAALLVPLFGGVAALAASWQRWINPFVDSGREMDVPWRLAQGERLYRDITYYYGPLGPWTNALALRLFGSRWLVLELVCAALSGLVFLLLFRITRRAGGDLSATAATALAATLCMGAPRGGAFLFPYSSSGLFALAGGLLAFDAATSPTRSSRRPLLCALGIAIAFSSRLEIGAVAAGALALAALRSSREEARADLGSVALGVLLAADVYLVAFAGLPREQWIAGGPFGPLLAVPAEWKALYLRVAGLAQPARTAGILTASLLLNGILLAAAGGWAPPGRGRRIGGNLVGAAGLLLCGACLGSGVPVLLRNLPPLLAILPLLAAGAALALLLRPFGPGDRERFLLFAWSAALASRVFFGLEIGPRMSAYATLPLPGLLATAAVLGFDRLAPRVRKPRLFRLRLAALFAGFGLLFLLRLELLDHQGRIVALDTPSGTLRLPAREAAALRPALAYLTLHARPGDTLAAFPEGGFFNFVLGLRSPLSHDLIVPGVLRGPADEAAAARELAATGPRYVLLCNRPTPEYGPESFGRDYATRLWSEVGERYRQVGSFGQASPTAPVGARRFFIHLYERLP